MPQPRSRSELVRQLLALSNQDEDAQEFEGLLRSRSTELQHVLAISELELVALGEMSPVERAKHTRNLVRQAVTRQKQVRIELNQNLAVAAATMLSGLAKWHDDHVALDSRIVLGNLLVDSNKKAIRFEAERFGKFVILRSKLKQARKGLKFSDLECFVDGQGLNFRWRDRAGHLLLTSQELPRKDKHSFVPVVLTRVRPRGTQVEPASGPHWAARALSDIAFA